MPTSSFVIHYSDGQNWILLATGFGSGWTEFATLKDRFPERRYRITTTSLIDGSVSRRY